MLLQIKLMADYDCRPLWGEGDHGPGNINPATLPLSGFSGEGLLDDPSAS